MRTIKTILSALLPNFLLKRLLSSYHLFLAWFGAVLYGFPARHMIVIGVTGTKGKTSTTEMVNAILEEAGMKTALMNSIRFKTDTDSKRNLTRMSMPGRFFIQRFLYNARKRGCTAAVLEMTSEGARQHRHRFIDLNTLIFTNLAPEHIESHGSLEAYANAKFEIGRELVRSTKRPRSIVANADDRESGRYLILPVENSIPFTLSGASPWKADERGGSFTLEGETISVHLPGEFSLKNALAASLTAHALGIPNSTIKRAFEKITTIPGRAERVEEGQSFTVVVDYAHTPDSLQALYAAYKGVRKICILGSTGGGRDTWKRPVMGRIADELCDVVILTNEDPYDEDPKQIVGDLAHGMTRKPTIIMDRREAIAHALKNAQPGDAVLITGKGTDPDIRGPHGTKQVWSDAVVAREELQSLLGKSAV
ncbi:UDP-N-acetylmuramyl-tripeptide synthetase [Candidatus Parcubacteria bacterium]|nr:MAG: UDP-N-acetylmuramyl-tripeptide synthetase [Candidatus Parcubacteria bacterium]